MTSQDELFVLTIEARDDGFPVARSSSASVIINVIDVNDHAPVFDLALYAKNVSEDAPVGRSLFAVTASDVDMGANADVIYALLPSQSSHLFSINQHTGDVTLLTSLNREQEAKHTFTVSARNMNDARAPSATTIVTVNIDDVHDNAPVFISGDVLSVREDAAVGHVIATLRATDADADGNAHLRYSITSSSPGADVVRVDRPNIERTCSHVRQWERQLAGGQHQLDPCVGQQPLDAGCRKGGVQR